MQLGDSERRRDKKERHHAEYYKESQTKNENSGLLYNMRHRSIVTSFVW
jgi:hypothetical protein